MRSSPATHFFILPIDLSESRRFVSFWILLASGIIVGYSIFIILFKINNTWMGFHTDLQKLSVILRRNLFPENLITNIFLNIFRQQSREGKHSLIQESSPRKHLSFSLKSLTLGTSQSQRRGVYANLLIGYLNLLI